MITDIFILGYNKPSLLTFSEDSFTIWPFILCIYPNSRKWGSSHQNTIIIFCLPFHLQPKSSLMIRFATHHQGKGQRRRLRVWTLAIMERVNQWQLYLTWPFSPFLMEIICQQASIINNTKNSYTCLKGGVRTLMFESDSKKVNKELPQSIKHTL